MSHPKGRRCLIFLFSSYASVSQLIRAMVLYTLGRRFIQAVSTNMLLKFKWDEYLTFNQVVQICGKHDPADKNFQEVLFARLKNTAKICKQGNESK